MTTNELIKAEIERLHQRGSGNWLSLMNQADTSYRQINYNMSQTLALLATDHFKTVKHVDLEWGRGTGKTTLLAAFARRIMRDLPRGVFQWEVPTYQKFLTEIIPAFIHGLEMQGLYKDLHYFIGRKPPAKWNWSEPYKPPIRYDNFIIFYNGFGINLLSQDIKGSGRGLSTDGRFASEAVLLDKKKLDEESGPSIRGSNMRELGNKRFFDFRIMESSTPLTESGKWFTERQDLALESPDKHRFLQANCVENIMLGFLKPDYLEVAKADSSDEETYNAEYLNIRPNFIKGGFYYLLNEKRHAYTNFDYTRHYTPDKVGIVPDCRGDADLVPGIPLIVCMDFGSAINSLVVAQKLPGEFRVLKNFYVKGAEGYTQDDVVERFHAYYQYHDCREVHFYHDASGNVSTGNTKVNRGTQASILMQNKGWRVLRLSLGGTNPLHTAKYRLWEKILDEKSPRLPKFRINKQNARETFISMSRAKTKQGANGEVKKWKGQERVDNPQRELATDLSDALDYGVYLLYNQLSIEYGSALPS